MKTVEKTSEPRVEGNTAVAEESSYDDDGEGSRRDEEEPECVLHRQLEPEARRRGEEDGGDGGDENERG